MQPRRIKPWGIDFVSDQLQDGTRFRSLTIVDVFTRVAVAIDAGQSPKGEDVLPTLNRAIGKEDDRPGFASWQIRYGLESGF